jgi:hypothetical protein
MNAVAYSYIARTENKLHDRNHPPQHQTTTRNPSTLATEQRQRRPQRTRDGVTVQFHSYGIRPKHPI